MDQHEDLVDSNFPSPGEARPAYKGSYDPSTNTLTYPMSKEDIDQNEAEIGRNEAQQRTADSVLKPRYNASKGNPRTKWNVHY